MNPLGTVRFSRMRPEVVSIAGSLFQAEGLNFLHEPMEPLCSSTCASLFSHMARHLPCFETRDWNILCLYHKAGSPCLRHAVDKARVSLPHDRTDNFWMPRHHTCSTGCREVTYVDFARRCLGGESGIIAIFRDVS